MPRSTEVRRGELTPVEIAFLGAVAAALFGSCWLLGCRAVWSQWVLFALCAAVFTTGIAHYVHRHRSGRIGGFAWSGWGLATAALAGFVLYVAIQSQNISHHPFFGKNDCWLVPQEHSQWLPSSVGGPFNGLVNGFIPTENAGRYLLIYGTVFLGTVGLILGVQSPTTISRITHLLVIHATIAALVCILHQASGSNKVLWISEDKSLFLGAPFFHYKNQNAVYQLLLFAWVLHWSREALGRRPWLVLSVCLVNAGGLFSIQSRAGLLFGCILLAVWAWTLRDPLMLYLRYRQKQAIPVFLVGVIALAAVFGLTGSRRAVERFGNLEPSLALILHGDTFRRLSHEIALEMFKDRPVLGWGGGAFLYTYATYEERVPEMAANRPGSSYYLLSRHADGDWYEFLVEYGLLGTGLFLLFWMPHFALWIRSRSTIQSGPLFLALAAGLLFYHGLIDQTFRNPGVLLLLFTTVVLTSKILTTDADLAAERGN